MGTMYYAIIDPCPHCGRGERHAICKSLRTFRAYLGSDPWGMPVTSWVDWKTVLTRAGVSVVDEYGEPYPSVDKFIADVEERGPQGTPRVQAGAYGTGSTPWSAWSDTAAWAQYAHLYSREGESFLDAEGYRFYSGDFS